MACRLLAAQDLVGNLSDTTCIGVSPKKGASETFGIDVIFCMASCLNDITLCIHLFVV